MAPWIAMNIIYTFPIRLHVRDPLFGAHKGAGQRTPGLCFGRNLHVFHGQVFGCVDSFTCTAGRMPGLG